MNYVIALALLTEAASYAQVPTPEIVMSPDSAHVAAGMKTAFAGLEEAIAAAPPGSTILIPSTYREVAVAATHTIPASKKDLKIQCAHGSAFQLGASGVAVFTIDGTSGVTIDGCTFDGQYSQHSYTGTAAIVSRGARFLTITNCLFQNIYGRGVRESTSLSVADISHNRFLNFGNGKVATNGGYEGITLNNSNHVNIEDNYFENFTSDDPIHLFNTTGPAGGGSARIVGNKGTGMARIAIEVQGAFWAHVDILNNSFDTWTQEGGMCISTGLAFQIRDARVSTAVGEIVDGNYCIQPAGKAVIRGLGLEMLGDDQVVANNTIAGPWSVGIVIGGKNQRVSRNTINGPTDHGIVVNPNYVVTGARITENTIYEPKADCINVAAADAAGDVISTNECSRTPGHWVGDSNVKFVHIALSTSSAPALMEDNLLTLEAAQTAGNFTWLGAFTLTGNAPGTAFRNNTIWNKNATAIGTGYWTNANFFNGTSITGGRNINLANIGTYPSNATITYRDNESLPGTGSTPATDWTITPTNFADLGAPRNGSRNYCSDCAIRPDNTCAGGGKGAEASRVNGEWVCFAKSN